MSNSRTSSTPPVTTDVDSDSQPAADGIQRASIRHSYFEGTMIDTKNEPPKTIAEFTFITNKSFLGRGNPITIPSRFYPALKENGLFDSTPASINFADDIPVNGAVKIGWRAGGKYFQIRANTPENHGITSLKLSVTLRVRLLSHGGEWRIELR